MSNTTSLSWLGVTNFNLIAAGRIEGYLQAKSEFNKIVEDEIKRCSFGISVDISEMLLKKITDAPILHVYLLDNNLLCSWVERAIEWTEAGASVETPALIEIPKSDFGAMIHFMTKDAFIKFLNSSWYKYAKLTDVPDSEDSIKFLFQLTL